MPEKQIVHKGHERSTLSAHRDIACTEIRYDRNARTFREDSRFSKLQSIGPAFMEHGLSMTANHLDRAVALYGAKDGFSIKFRELVVKARDGRSVGLGVRDREDGGAGARAIGGGSKTDG